MLENKEEKNWRGNPNWKRPSFPPPNAIELTNIIEFPFVQSHMSEEFLRQKYVVEGLSPMEIGEICFSSQRSIVAWLRSFRIPLRPEDVPHQRGLRFGEKRVRGRVIPDDRELKILNKMKVLRGKGYSYPQIVEVLNSLGLRSKSGGQWHLKTVFEILNR